MQGRVADLIAVKNFGFILGENGQRYFFHRDDLNGNWLQLCQDWKDSQIEVIMASFEAKSTPKGPRASNVNLIQQT